MASDDHGGRRPAPGDSAIVGPGNIGTTCWRSCGGSEYVDVRGTWSGVDPASDGLARAAALGLQASAGDWLLAQDLPAPVLEATSMSRRTWRTPSATPRLASRRSTS
ncbi:acetaldehyde dehydrogenase domain protein [Mycobacterium intracellulare MIN_052511_1280]|nr:acetaldehyde dehydrogenase domain protein [Mycobacterium intracellulare MIN_052511_1280]